MNPQGPPAEVAGTSGGNLVTPCGEYATPAPPEPVATEPPFALSFSGGGWRAALTAAGVLRFVADAGLADRIRWVSSVSGGSITNGLFATGYETIADAGFTRSAVDAQVLAPLLAGARDRSLAITLLTRAWRALGRRTRTDVLADVFDEWFFHGRELHELASTCRFVINAGNVTTGVRFGFERDVLGDYVLGTLPTRGTGLRVADAVAASAAVPGPFPAMRLRGLRFPCGSGADVRLLDGGVYDNLGLEALDDLQGPCLVVVSAGGVFRTKLLGPVRFIPIVRDLKRAESLLYRQATALRARTMVDRFKAWEATPPGTDQPTFARRGVLFGLATTLKATDEWREGRPDHDDRRVELATTKTSFSRFAPDLCEALVYRGWWLAGALLSKRHRELLPDRLPRWAPLP